MAATQQIRPKRPARQPRSRTISTSLLNREFKPKSDKARDAVQAAVQTLAEQALANTALISDDVDQVDRGDDRRDRRETDRADQPDHPPPGLPAARRLVARAASPGEQHRDGRDTSRSGHEHLQEGDGQARSKKFKGTAWDQSPLFKKIYEEEYGQFGGEPFGLLMGDYYFDHSPQDVELLGDMAQIAAAAHAPFIAAAAPTVMQMESWQRTGQSARPDQDLPNPRICGLAVAARERGLALHRPVHAALPGPPALRRQDRTGRGIQLRGRRRGGDSSKYYLVQRGLRDGHEHHPRVQALRLVLADPRRRERRRGRGLAGAHLPERRRRRGDEVPDRDRHQRPARSGVGQERLHAAVFKKNTDFAAFIGAQSLQKPQEYLDPAATANANLSARLPYLFATCRFAHYLKCMVRDKIGSSKTQSQLQGWLQNWLNLYVDGSPDSSSDEFKASHPLAEGKVVLEANEENPGYYAAKFYLKPHYQLEGLTVSLRLVSKMPA